MTRPAVNVEMSVAFDAVDDTFDWWMRQYDREPDGQFLDIARQLQPYVTTAMFDQWRSQFEHPKGESVVVVNLRGHAPEGVCERHGRPAAPGYCA